MKRSNEGRLQKIEQRNVGDDDTPYVWTAFCPIDGHEGELRPKVTRKEQERWLEKGRAHKGFGTEHVIIYDVGCNIKCKTSEEWIAKYAPKQQD